MSKKLIAMVATAVMVAGVRTVIQPGEELPELTKHDERELLGSGAASNPEDIAAIAQADARAEAATQREFQDARKRATEAQASTVVDLKTAASIAEKDALVIATAAETILANVAPAPEPEPAPAPAKTTPKTAKR